MKYGIVSFNNRGYHDVAIDTGSPLYTVNNNSKTKQLWRNTLSDLGFVANENDLTIKDMFLLVKDAFEKKFGKRLSIRFDKKYIASTDGARSVPHNESSRIFSTPSLVYVDDLMVSVLFEYVATYYLWARYGKPVYAFCFAYAINTMNRCCRQGFLNSDQNKVRLVSMLKEYCDDRGVQLIADLYWSVLAFALSHEIAHIFLEHTSGDRMKSKDELWTEEYDADAVGYDVYLGLVEQTIPGLASPFLSTFHDYLYAAPMILFLFYGDLYYMDYWAFGEVVGNTHPPLTERINHLLKISEDSKYQFDTSEGNAVLDAFWNMSDTFREELFYKLKNGKLEEFVRGGYNTMGDNYAEAMLFNEQMCDEMREFAIKEGLDAKRMVGLYDIASRVEMGSDSSVGFVWSYHDEVHSTKLFNVFFRMRATLTAIIENGLTLSLPENKTQTVMLALFILFKLCQVSTTDITPEQAMLLIECHNQNAYRSHGVYIDEDAVLQKLQISSTAVSDLKKMGCLDIQDGKISLLEEVLIKPSNP